MLLVSYMTNFKMQISLMHHRWNRFIYMHASDIAFSLTCSTHLFPVVKYVDRRLSIFMQFLLGLQRIHYNMELYKNITDSWSTDTNDGRKADGNTSWGRCSKLRMRKLIAPLPREPQPLRSAHGRPIFWWTGRIRWSQKQSYFAEDESRRMSLSVKHEYTF